MTKTWLVLLFICSNLHLLSQALEIPGFISIDCGAERNYTDGNTNIPYSTDTGFSEFGQNYNVSNTNLSQVETQQLITKRIFSNGKRNCYTLRPEQGKNNLYLIRASFDYGYYDVEFQPPVFDLYIDTNYWATVNSSRYTYKEIVYVPTRDYVHVCLVNTNTGIPLISALELRLLDDSTYNLTSGAMKTFVRVNIGSLNDYRYPEDDYDRIWRGRLFRSWLVTSTVNKTTINTIRTNNNAFGVPPEVLATAQRSDDSSIGLALRWSSPDPKSKWLIYLHFTELEFISNPNSSRDIQIYIADNFITTIKPEYLKPLTVVSPQPFSDSPLMNFSIFASNQANLPVFINAVEIFDVLDLPNSITDLDDVNAIITIKETYELRQESWQGDPCLPIGFTWTGLECSQIDPPRILALNLSFSGLSGPISPSFSNLTELVSLDLSMNQLGGELPEFFAEMLKLKFLNLSGNNLIGSIPEALKKKMADGTLQLSLDGNPLCETDTCNPSLLPKTTPSPAPSSSTKKNEGISSVVAAVAAFAAFAAFALAVI